MKKLRFVDASKRPAKDWQRLYNQTKADYERKCTDALYWKTRGDRLLSEMIEIRRLLEWPDIAAAITALENARNAITRET